MKMLKRTSIVLFGVVAIVAILTASELVAQDCVAPDLGLNCMKWDKFTVWIVPDQNGLFPTFYPVDNSYIYNYKVDCDPRLVNYIDITLPISINPGVYNSVTKKWSNIETSVSLSPPPIWEPSTYWLFTNCEGDFTFAKDVCTLNVLKLEIKKVPTFYFSVKIKNNQVGQIQQSIWLRSGFYYRSGLILGPASAFLAQTLSYAPATQVVSIKLGPGEICVGKDTAGCINDVFECDGSYHYPITTIQSVIVDGSPLQYAGGEGGGGCPTIILVTQHSPLCYTIGSGGNASKVCYCPLPSDDCTTVGFSTCDRSKVPNKCR